MKSCRIFWLQLPGDYAAVSPFILIIFSDAADDGEDPTAVSLESVLDNFLH